MKLSDLIQKHQKVPVKHYPHQVEEKPMVSVCVQTYQHVGFIKQCLDGILMQHTTFPFEILLGEDESTDGTREICIEYAQKYPDKIRLFLHSRENNIKVNNRATGRFNLIYTLNQAKGKYIATCEGDDYWKDKLKLEKQVAFLEANNSYVMTFHDARIINEDGTLFKESIIRGFKNLEKKHLSYVVGHLPTLTVMFKNIKLELPEEFLKILNADMFLHTYIGQFGSTARLEVNEVYYRLHGGGIWSSIEEYNKALELIHSYKVLIKSVKNKRVYKELHQNYTRILYYLTILDFKRYRFLSAFLRSFFLIYRDIKFDTKYTFSLLKKTLFKVFNK